MDGDDARVSDDMDHSFCWSGVAAGKCQVAAGGQWFNRLMGQCRNKPHRADPLDGSTCTGMHRYRRGQPPGACGVGSGQAASNGHGVWLGVALWVCVGFSPNALRLSAMGSVRPRFAGMPDRCKV